MRKHHSKELDQELPLLTAHCLHLDMTAKVRIPEDQPHGGDHGSIGAGSSPSVG